MSDLERALDPSFPRAPIPATPRVTRPAASYALRALSTEAELYESYRLRYETYSALGYLQHSNRSRLDIDVYDLSSIAFGAFDTATGAMIGTLRLITTELQRDADRLIGHVLTECSDADLTQQALEPHDRDLPSIVSDQVARQIVAFNTPQLPIYEFSRFIVHPDYRLSHVSRSLGALGMAYAMQSGPALFIAGCLPQHNRLYASYGFVKLPDTDLDYFDSVGQIANTIVCRSDILPGPIQSQIDDLLRGIASGSWELTRELGRNARAVYRLAAPGRDRRELRVW